MSQVLAAGAPNFTLRLREVRDTPSRVWQASRLSCTSIRLTGAPSAAIGLRRPSSLAGTAISGTPLINQQRLGLALYLAVAIAAKLSQEEL
jgi:hypothetical protein